MLWVGGILSALLAWWRWSYESSMVELVPSDGQNPIWLLYSAGASIGTFFLCLAFIYIATEVFLQSKRSRAYALLPLCGFLFVAGCTGNTLREHSSARAALLDAADPSTSAARLSELIGYQSGFGYEVDNRIAKHPNATPDILRALSARPNQGGTLMVLARNPNTPEDVIIALAKNPDKLLQEVLKGRLTAADN